MSSVYGEPRRQSRSIRSRGGGPAGGARTRPAALFIMLACLAVRTEAQSGRELIEESLRRHAQPPYVYAEQALVLSDRLGQHTVRTARYYARRDENGSKSLLVIETPAESQGTAIYVARDARGGARRGAAASSPVFGSNFSVADLEGEQPQNFRYEREDDHDLDRVPHHLLRASPLDESVARAMGYGERRIYLRKDNLFVSRIDYQDRLGRLAKRQTFRIRPDPALARGRFSWRICGQRRTRSVERRCIRITFRPRPAGLP